MPVCACYHQDWASGNANINPITAVAQFKCNNCERDAVEVSGYYQGPLVLISTIGGVPRDVRMGNVFDYINESLLVQWRSLEEEARKPGGGMNEKCPIPPAFGSGIEIAFRRKGKDEWEPILLADTIDIEVPQDPIKLRHDERWIETFRKLELEGGLHGQFHTGDVKRIPNQYYDDRANNEPWFEFMLHGAKFVVGPRKRVISIEVEKEEPFPVGNIANLAREANTSYWADDGWNNWDQSKAKKIVVHAWNQENVIRYIGAIVEGLT